MNELTTPGGGPRGRFIVVEGVEGAGKTTQTARLGEWLASQGVQHRVVREPGGTPVGEAIRGVVLDRPELFVPAETELLLILAARAAFVREVVKPALERGETVLSDRYFHSTFAYQGFGRGLDLEAVRALNDFACGSLVPDLVMVLDVPVSVGRVRQQLQGKRPDRMEQEGDPFLERVRSGYLELADTESNAVLIDATGSGDEVHELILRAVQDRFDGTFGALKD